MNELSCVTLRKVDPSKNMARQYSVAVCRDLFGTPVVVCRWGRIGRAGRTNQRVCGSLEEAQALAEELVEKRSRRGHSDTGDGTACTARVITAQRSGVAAPVPARRRQPAKEPGATGQLWLLDWKVAEQGRLPVRQRTPVAVNSATSDAPPDGFALMRTLGKPATPADRERAMSILTLAAGLRGIPLGRGSARPLASV